jgi:hypothetical protein
MSEYEIFFPQFQGDEYAPGREHFVSVCIPDAIAIRKR